MFNRLLFPAILLVAGCDDANLLANIDVYTCAYLPGVIDCTTQEVHDRAVTLLQHGVVSAEVECRATVTLPAFTGSGSNPAYGHYKATRFVDGSCFALIERGSYTSTASDVPTSGNHFSDFIERTDVRSSTCAVVFTEDYRASLSHPYRPNVDGLQGSVAGGFVTVQYNDAAFAMSPCTTGSSCTDHITWFSRDITGADCTGFNLHEFGATP